MPYRRRRRYAPITPRTISGDSPRPESLAPVSFDSWSDFVNKAETGTCSLTTEQRASLDLESSNGWTGTRNIAEASNLAKFGWADGTGKATKLAYPLIDKIAAQMQREEFTYETSGICFDVARVLENEPECWMQCEQVTTQSQGKVLKLVFNGFVSGGVSHSAIIAKGAVITALVSVLERANYRVQVDLVFAMAGFNRALVQEIWIPIKSADQSLDVSRLIFALAHPSCFRRLCFSVMEQLPEHARQAIGAQQNHGYGSPADVPKERQGDIYIACASFNDPYWENETTATAWILSQLRAQGIEISENN